MIYARKLSVNNGILGNNMIPRRLLLRKEVATFYSSTWVSWTLESPSIFLYWRNKKNPEIKGLWRFSIAKIDEKKAKISSFLYLVFSAWPEI
jgi:hypothetical protein